MNELLDIFNFCCTEGKIDWVTNDDREVQRDLCLQLSIQLQLFILWKLKKLGKFDTMLLIVCASILNYLCAQNIWCFKVVLRALRTASHVLQVLPKKSCVIEGEIASCFVLFVLRASSLLEGVSIWSNIHISLVNQPPKS